MSNTLLAIGFTFALLSACLGLAGSVVELMHRDWCKNEATTDSEIEGCLRAYPGIRIEGENT